MDVKVITEVEEIEDGTYDAVLTNAFEYTEGELCMKFTLENDKENRIFVKFYKREDFETRSWSSVFKALDTSNTDDLIGNKFRLEVKNNKSKTTGKNFCNIRKIEVIS